MKPEVMLYKWRWHWRETDGSPDCGIFAEIRPGQAYSVARCPRYVERSEWEAVATYICDLHNAAIAKAEGQS